MIVGNYAKYETYIKPDSIHGTGFVFGAWKVQVEIDKVNDTWSFKIAQGQQHVECKQTVHKKNTKKPADFKSFDKCRNRVEQKIYCINPHHTNTRMNSNMVNIAHFIVVQCILLHVYLSVI